VSGHGDSIREGRAQESWEDRREEDDIEEKKIRSMIERTLFVLLVVAITATTGAILSADVHWLLVMGFGVIAGVSAGAGLVLLVIYQELRRFRR
jgi:hypothetical protein